MTRGLLCGALLVLTAAFLPRAAAQTSGFDSSRAYEHLRQIVALGPRPAGSAASAKTRQYIADRLRALALDPIEQRFDADTPIGRIRMTNVSVTLPGARRERLIVGGHYDTKRFRQVRFVGANDGGSSTAFLLELARALKGRRHAFTVELVFFDGEEAVIDWTGTDHTYGSRHYVADARRTGALRNIKAMILVDMIGDRDLHVRREAASTRWLTDLIWASARQLGHAAVFGDDTLRIEDDHLPFLEAGIPAVNLIDLDYPAWHTPADALDQTSARSLQVVGDVLLGALPDIEARLIGK